MNKREQIEVLRDEMAQLNDEIQASIKGMMYCKIEIEELEKQIEKKRLRVHAMQIIIDDKRQMYETINTQVQELVNGKVTT